MKEHPFMYLLEALIAVRMLASMEARLGQRTWADAVPLMDDAIERATEEMGTAHQ